MASQRDGTQKKGVEFGEAYLDSWLSYPGDKTVIAMYDNGEMFTEESSHWKGVVTLERMVTSEELSRFSMLGLWGSSPRNSSLADFAKAVMIVNESWDIALSFEVPKSANLCRITRTSDCSGTILKAWISVNSLNQDRCFARLGLPSLSSSASDCNCGRFADVMQKDDGNGIEKSFYIEKPTQCT